MGLSKTVTFEQSAPLGLFISALINASKEPGFELNLHNYPNSFHFMGYRLREDKHLSVIGDLGHFTGAGMCGGYLKVTGSTGSWCGAAMISGRINVTGDAHSKIGEQMKGGQIHVCGRIQEIARHRSGGDIQSRHGESRHP
jgi:formylmethanofuran dehydrogenase subunit C